MSQTEQILDALSPTLALEVVRAFSAYFGVVNMAEQVHRLRRRRLRPCQERAAWQAAYRAWPDREASDLAAFAPAASGLGAPGQKLQQDFKAGIADQFPRLLLEGADRDQCLH